MAAARCWRRILVLLHALGGVLRALAGVLPSAQRDASASVDPRATLRAPGASANDGRIIIGVLAVSGKPAALAQHQHVFSDYLNAVLGASTGLYYATVAVEDSEIYAVASERQLDFIFTYSSHFTCLSSQFGARLIASAQSMTYMSSPPYVPVNVTSFGGAFFTLASRTDIMALADIAGKRLVGGDLTSLGAGQAQWRELSLRGLSFWDLPSQVMFSHNQYAVAEDVAAGVADVGMVRSDVLEALQLPPPLCNATAQAAVGLGCFPPGTFKILEPTVPAGSLFNSSTREVWPEWPLAAMPHVDMGIQKAVAQALFALGADASMAQYTAPARLATFTPSLNYISVRDMLHAQGWVVNGSCITATQIYAAVVCPAGTYRRAPAAIARACAAANLACPAAYDCVCSPCAPLVAEPFTLTAGNTTTVCSRMQPCFTAVQNQPFSVALTDNWFDARAELGLAAVSNVLVKLDFSLAGLNPLWMPAVSTGAGTWALNLTSPSVGIFLLQAQVDGAEVDDSPTLLAVKPPMCPGRGALPDAVGVCACPPGQRPSGAAGDCASPPSAALVQGAAGGSAGGACLLLAILATVVIMRRRAEALWRIPASAVEFQDPPEVLGRGTFGLVVRGKYRGTTVALKRSLPTETKARRWSFQRGASSSRSSDQVSRFDLQLGEEQADTDVELASPKIPPLPAGQRSPRAAHTKLHESGSRSRTSSGGSANTPSSAQPGAAAPARAGLLDAIVAELASRRRAAALRRDFVREMRLLVHLRHPHILTVLGAVLQDAEPILVMEYMDRGSLYDLLHNETLPLDGDVVLRILQGVVSGIEFLHSASPPLLHNDIKSANVLVDASFRAKVSDFGLSVKRRAARGPPGTPLWMAPELLRSRKAQPSTATDVYSFGILLSEVFNRADPYAEDQMPMRDLLRCIAAPPDGPPPKRPNIGRSVPFMFADLMARCWHPLPAARPSFASIGSQLRMVAEQDGAAASNVTAALLAAKQRTAGERKLLNAVFPPAVAAALAEGRRVEPQEFACVTVFFSDIVGFTDISARLAPAKVMHMLDRLYNRLDLLTAKHGLFKVETIGDAYLACGALMEGQEHDHALRVAGFALDAVDAAAGVAVDEDDPSAGNITIRAGFHSGPVVASVVGRTNPRYCLFGDTVNTANRMESKCVPSHLAR